MPPGERQASRQFCSASILRETGGAGRPGLSPFPHPSVTYSSLVLRTVFWLTLTVARRTSHEIDPEKLSGWRLLDNFRARLERLAARFVLHPSFADARRKLAAGEYLCLFLFGLLNPTVRTMRGLCAASKVARVQREICGRAVSQASFSDAQHLLDPDLLGALLAELGAEALARNPAARAGGLPNLSAVDATLWEALPRMAWAVWRTQGKTQRAVKLEVKFHVLSQVPQLPVVAPGKTCERKLWRKQWRAGDFFVADRYYAEDYGIFDELAAAGCSYIIRLRDEATINWEEALPLSAADRAAGVVRDGWATLGSRPKHRSRRVRVVEIQTAKCLIRLVSDGGPERLSAELIAQLYRQRWEVELFFRWIKCTLGCRHWLAESQRGVTIQVYLALIAAVLLQLYVGERPNKRMMELIQLYLSGIARLDELERLLAQELARVRRARSRARIKKA